MNRLPFLVLVFFISGCVEEEILVNSTGSGISPEFGVPIARATIRAEEVIERFDDDGLVVEGENEILTLIYRDSLESVSAAELLDFDDFSFSESVELSEAEQGLLQLEGEVTLAETVIYQIDLEPDRLDSIRFASGLLELTYVVPSGFELTGVISILDPATEQDLITINIEDQGGGVVSTTVDLDNNLLLFVPESADTPNGLLVDYDLDITSLGSDDSLDTLGVDFSITDFSIQSVGGYISPRTYSIEDQSSDINIFESDFDGNIRLEDPRLNLFLLNGFGIELQPILDNVTLFEEGVPQDSIVAGNIEPFPVLQGASFEGDQAISEVVIDNSKFISGSNLTELLSDIRPDSVSGSFDIAVNPENEPLSFISRDSELGIEFEVEFPIYGSISGFEYEDTTEVDLGDLIQETNENEEVEQLNLRLFVSNALPIEAGVQMVFTDSLLTPIDSLFEEVTMVVPAAPIDLSPPVGSPDYGRVIGQTERRVDIEIPRERVSALENADRVIVRVVGHTTGNNPNEPIRLYPEDFIEVYLGAEVILNFELE